MRTEDNELLSVAASLDERIEEAKIYITQVEADMEIEWRLRKCTNGLSDCLVVFHPDGEMPGSKRPALTVLGIENTVHFHQENGVVRFQLKGVPPGRTGSYLLCSEQSAQKLRKEVRDYLAHERVNQTYDIELELQAKLELRSRKEDASRLVDRTIAEAWSIAVNCMNSGVEYLILNQTGAEANLTLQIRDRIFPRMNEEGWMK